MYGLAKIVGVVFAVSIFFCSPSIEAGTVETEEDCHSVVLGICSVDFKIKGTISKNIEEEIHQKIRNIKNRGDKLRWCSVTVDSSGGDVYTAMRIGRLLRQEEARVVVLGGASCFSSCVLILAGGVQRQVLGKVGIHRPYFYDFPKDLKDDQIKPTLNKLWSDVRSYLTEMNIPSFLFEEMVSIPPSEIKILSKDELRRFCLNQDDPAWEEKYVRRQAERYGLTAAEYRRRDALAKKAEKEDCLGQGFCNSGDLFDDLDNCRESILWGLSLERYCEGLKRVKKTCKKPEDPAPWGHWEAYEKCVQNFWSDHRKGKKR
jgi:hypothetical protein